MGPALSTAATTNGGTAPSAISRAAVSPTCHAVPCEIKAEQVPRWPGHPDPANQALCSKGGAVGCPGRTGAASPEPANSRIQVRRASGEQAG